MQIRSLLLIIFCATNAVQADETWGQWALRGLFATGKSLAGGTGYVASKISKSPLIEKYKKQATIAAGVGGAAIIGTGVWYSYTRNKKLPEIQEITKLDTEAKRLKKNLDDYKNLLCKQLDNDRKIKQGIMQEAIEDQEEFIEEIERSEEAIQKNIYSVNKVRRVLGISDDL
ncbi:MAG: hypothetical protein M1114_03655 [Candidatus Dependentiae bacterium]|nr:hypothetical protein [Candidatus Dependentiae bacterium]